MNALRVGHYAALLNAVRARVAELGISYELVDEIAGLTSGHFSKLVCDPPIKRMGSLTLFLVLEALGLQVALTDDMAALERTKRRYIKPAKPHHMQRLRASRQGLARNMLWADYLRLRAQKGGEARARKLGYRKMARIARKAANARWRKAGSATAGR